MPDISLTTFVDFLAASGRKKILTVEKAKREDNLAYDPKTDFYKKLRDSIISLEEGKITVAELKALPETLTDPKKKTNYPPAIDGYLNWRKKKAVQPTKKVRGIFEHGELRVRINPEANVQVDGKRLALKLYFKQPPLAVNRAELITHLMWFGMPDGFTGNVALMDTRRGKVLTIEKYDPKFRILLEAEAETFLKLWE